MLVSIILVDDQKLFVSVLNFKSVSTSLTNFVLLQFNFMAFVEVFKLDESLGVLFLVDHDLESKSKTKNGIFQKLETRVIESQTLKSEKIKL